MVVAAVERESPGNQAHGECDRHDDQQSAAQASGATDSDRRRSLWFLGGSEVGVVLVDEPLGVEAEVVRVGSEETLGVRGGGEAVELFVFERLQKLRPDPCVALDPGQIQLLKLACLAKTAADLEHCDS
jgi:hypothetical protein